MLTFDELRRICFTHDAYLVGGGARYVVGKLMEARAHLGVLPVQEVFAGLKDATPHDWDVLVEGELPTIFDELYTFTKFGGRRYTRLDLDIWQGSIGKYLRNVHLHEKCLAVHLETGVVLGTHEFFLGYSGHTGRGTHVPKYCDDRFVLPRKP
jgi:hypothetical protein